jgi:hypothetical protein
LNIGGCPQDFSASRLFRFKTFGFEACRFGGIAVDRGPHPRDASIAGIAQSPNRRFARPSYPRLNGLAGVAFGPASKLSILIFVRLQKLMSCYYECLRNI